MKLLSEDEQKEITSEDWKWFAQYFEKTEGFPPTYGDTRAMMLFNYFCNGAYMQWFQSNIGK